MFTITKEFNFEASHQLTGLPEGHKCMNVHGHSYIVIVELQSVLLNEVGFVRDYRELDEIKRFLDENFDHRHLNDIFHCNPTAENIAFYLYTKFHRIFPEISAVSVKETAKTCARFAPDKYSTDLINSVSIALKNER